MEKSHFEQIASEKSNFTAVTLNFQNNKLLQELVTRSNVRSNFFIFCLITNGRSSVRINLKDFEVRKNNLLIIPPDATKENIFISHDAECKVIAYTSDFLIDLPLPENFWSMMDYYSAKNIPVWELQEEETQELKNLFSQIENYSEAVSTHLYGYQILQYAFMIFIMEVAALASTHSQPSNHRYSRKEVLTIEFYSLAKKQFKKNRSVQHFASLLFITPRYLTETIKEISGKTAGEVIDFFIIQEAKIQLTNTTKSISEISTELNFSDQSSFGKFFKRITGTSPTAFRAKI